MSSRQRCIVIAGTGTEVGKTWTAVQLIRIARERGLTVAARKPAQSFAARDGRSDAELLAAASGERAEDVCPPHRWYGVPMAPPMAADALGLAPIALADLLQEMTWSDSAQLVVIETAGGLRSPIAHDADNLDLILRIDAAEVLLVADAGLGTLNSVRLCMQALRDCPTRVFLNRYDPTDELHRRNRSWLTERDGLQVVTDLQQFDV